LIQFRLDNLLEAVGANTMAELGLRVLRNVAFDLLPEVLVVPDFLAIRTDRD
jgi:hypothetical protein